MSARALLESTSTTSFRSAGATQPVFGDLGERLRNASSAFPGFGPGLVPALFKERLRFALFGKDEALSVGLSTPGGPGVLVVVPREVWKVENLRHRLLALRSEAKADGLRMIIAQHGYVGRQPRLDNLQMIGLCRSTGEVAPDDALRCQLALVEDPTATLSDLACVVGALQPYACVLSLVGRGVLRIRHDRMITPSTEVSIGLRA